MTYLKSWFVGLRLVWIILLNPHVTQIIKFWRGVWNWLYWRRKVPFQPWNLELTNNLKTPPPPVLVLVTGICKPKILSVSSNGFIFFSRFIDYYQIFLDDLLAVVNGLWIIYTYMFTDEKILSKKMDWSGFCFSPGWI